MKQLELWSCAVLAISCLVGCGGGDDGPPRASVAGRLTIGGKPVPGVDVNFVNPDFRQHGSFAKTDDDGNFRLVQGAVVGVNTVFFSKITGGDGASLDPESGMDAGQFEAMAVGNEGAKRGAPKAEQVIPVEYSNSSSKLTFHVPEGGTDSANFEL